MFGIRTSFVLLAAVIGLGVCLMWTPASDEAFPIGLPASDEAFPMGLPASDEAMLILP